MDQISKAMLDEEAERELNRAARAGVADKVKQYMDSFPQQHPEAEALQARKLPAIQQAERTSRRGLDMVLRAQEIFTDPDDQKFFRKSIVLPAQRRHAKDCASLVFWQNIDQVSDWLRGRPYFARDEN